MRPEKILVIGPSWVGDMVLAQSLFIAISQKNPQSIIDVAAPGWTLPLLERMPQVNKAIALPFKHGQLALGARIRFGRGLIKEGYTQAILLTNSFKSTILPFAARIPKRTGFLGEFRYGLLNDIRKLDKASILRTVDRFNLLGLDSKGDSPQNSPKPTLAASPQNAAEALRRLGYSVPKTKVLGLCPGAEYGEAKRWPAEYYAEVANEGLENGWQVWLFGSEKDTVVTEAINELTNNKCLNLGGKTSLGEAIDLMSLCDTVISNDSGLMHVAAALDKKMVAIFGSSDPKHTPPMSEYAVIEYLSLPCSPCFQRQCPLKHLNCLRDISPHKISSHVLMQDLV